MTKALYLIGGAGVGKTTILQKHTEAFTVSPAIRLNKQLWAEPLQLGDVSAYRLGKARFSFAGTDALGMAVNPDAIEWVQEHPLPDFIYGEGQRLSNFRFLYALHSRTDLHVLHIVNNNAHLMREERALRLGVRQQSPSFVKATETKSDNLVKLLIEAQVKVTVVNTTGFRVDEAVTQIASASRQDVFALGELVNN